MQGNTSDVLNLTHMNFSSKEGNGNNEPLEYLYTIGDVLMKDIPVSDAIYSVVDKLDILPANMYFEMYDEWLKKHFQNSKEQFFYIEKKLSPVFNNYDVVYFDVPSSISIYSKSAMYLAD